MGGLSDAREMIEKALALNRNVYDVFGSPLLVLPICVCPFLDGILRIEHSRQWTEVAPAQENRKRLRSREVAANLAIGLLGLS
jgi:hypothetical protein